MGGTRTIRIVVLGDEGVGKSSLVMSLLTESFPDSASLPSVIPEVAIPSKYNPDNVDVFIADTPSTVDTLGERPVDAVVLVYDVQSENGFRRLQSHWLPWLAAQSCNVPVILAGNKIDMRGEDMSNARLEEQIMPLMAEHRCVETCIECSARQMINVSEVFYFAQKAVVHPSGPLYDPQENVVKEACLSALQRIFRHCDLDGNGFLDDSELDSFQRRCFRQPLQKTDIQGVKETIMEGFPEGVTPLGITEAGFVHLNKMFIQRGRLETTWAILRAFGYNDQLKVELPQVDLSGESTMELTNYGVDKLKQLFYRFSKGEDDISPGQLNDLFRLSTDGTNPWLPHFPKSAFLSENGDLPLDSFIAQWMMFTYELPFESTAYFTELVSITEVPKSFKVVPFERTDQRRVFRVAVMDGGNEGKDFMQRLVNPATESVGVVKVKDSYLILSLNDAEPDLCDLVLTDQTRNTDSYVAPSRAVNFTTLQTADLELHVKETQRRHLSGRWKTALIGSIAAITLGAVLYYRHVKKQ